MWHSCKLYVDDKVKYTYIGGESDCFAITVQDHNGREWNSRWQRSTENKLKDIATMSKLKPKDGSINHKPLIHAFMLKMAMAFPSYNTTKKSLKKLEAEGFDTTVISAILKEVWEDGVRV